MPYSYARNLPDQRLYLGQPPFHRPDRAGQYQQQDKSGAQHDQAALG